MELKALNDLSYGMYVICTKYNNKNVGCFANTVCQLTSKEILISVSINKDNYTNEAIKETKLFTVSTLSEQTNKEVIGKFGFFSSKDTDKFKDFNVLYQNNLPIINENICSYLICELVNVIDLGTHDLFIAKVLECEKNSDLPPMTYSYYHQVIKGTAPEKAPTYLEPIQESNSKKYKCLICGYVYDDSIESIKFEDLPADWRCPICGVGKENFREII